MFLDNKYTKWYNQIISNAQSETRNKKEQYYESHHIIPRSMGGIETVLLTAKEHFICHLLLCRMCDGSNKHKMINALIKMSFSKSNGQKRHTAKSYSLVRKLIAEKNTEMFKGVPKSETARKNMKGRSGTWKRTEEHKKKIRGANNPMYGLRGNLNPSSRPEVKKKISEKAMGNKRGLGNKSVAGLIWVNNGIARKMVDSNNIPSGFVKGKKLRGD